MVTFGVTFVMFEVTEVIKKSDFGYWWFRYALRATQPPGLSYTAKVHFLFRDINFRNFQAGCIIQLNITAIVQGCLHI